MPSKNYSLLERVLHHLALGQPYLSEASFDLEQALAAKSGADVIAGRHIFVSGLARAGTTALMRALYQTGQFRSLTYRDMPFVLMPTLWRSLSGRFQKTGEAQERAHGDALRVDFDSPEAFEEVFWRVFAGETYLHKDCLTPHDPDSALIERFQRYVAAILDGQPRLYLSKNNNSILRLAAIRKAFPRALILVPFRNPLHQAASLRGQHARFCALQNTDKFALAYMTWLGHHEFGLTHRPFVFEPSERGALARQKQSSIEYWLSLWIHAYRHVLARAPSDAMFVCYEDLCAHPTQILDAIIECAGLHSRFPEIGQSIVPAQRTADEEIDGELKSQALSLYDALLTRRAQP